MAIATTRRRRVCAGLAWAAACSLVAACGTPKDPFLHRGHRMNYAIESEEFGSLQFFISTEVLAHAIDSGAAPAARDVVILEAGTPGRVIDAGAYWLRVAFEENGPGVAFLALAEGPDSLYKLATEIEGAEGLARVEEREQKILRRQGRSYRIVYGESAHLLVSRGDLEATIARRRHARGLER